MDPSTFPVRWRKSSYSGSDTNCVELGALPAAPAWRKSSRSANGSECVEVAPFAHRVGVRDSKRPAQPPLSVRPTAWTAFAAQLRTGGFGLDG